MKKCLYLKNDDTNTDHEFLLKCNNLANTLLTCGEQKVIELPESIAISSSQTITLDKILPTLLNQVIKSPLSIDHKNIIVANILNTKKVIPGAVHFNNAIKSELSLEILLQLFNAGITKIIYAENFQQTLSSLNTSNRCLYDKINLIVTNYKAAAIGAAAAACIAAKLRLR